MKALDEYFLMVVFTLLLNRVRVFANFMFKQRNETIDWHSLFEAAQLNLFPLFSLFRHWCLPSVVFLFFLA